MTKLSTTANTKTSRITSRTLRFNSRIGNINQIEKKTISSTTKQKKYDFKQYEKDLLNKYPIPQTIPLALPESYKSLHTVEFIKGLELILSKDPSLYPLIIHEPFDSFHIDSETSITTQDHFAKICKSIIGQQISGAAALSIMKKFRNLYDHDKFPTPEQVLETSLEDLKKSGLSIRKSEYIKSAAEFFQSENKGKDLDFNKLTNEQIIEKLILIKGIAEWSAKMFLAFSLKRLDVFASDDLGVARGVSRYLESRPFILDRFKNKLNKKKRKKSKFDDGKKRDWKVIHDEYVDLLANEFKPYRTVFMLVMWRASATNIQVLT